VRERDILRWGDWERPRLLAWYLAFHRECRLRRMRERKLAQLNNLRRREAAEKAASRNLRAWLDARCGGDDEEAHHEDVRLSHQIQSEVGTGEVDERNNSRTRRQARWGAGAGRSAGEDSEEETVGGGA
jgi:hypothetical protein